jgi:hypothetical protein
MESIVHHDTPLAMPPLPTVTYHVHEVTPMREFVRWQMNGCQGERPWRFVVYRYVDGRPRTPVSRKMTNRAAAERRAAEMTALESLVTA